MYEAVQKSYCVQLQNVPKYYSSVNNIAYKVYNLFLYIYTQEKG